MCTVSVCAAAAAAAYIYILNLCSKADLKAVQMQMEQQYFIYEIDIIAHIFSCNTTTN